MTTTTTKKLSWHRISALILFGGVCIAACSVLLDHDKAQCATDSDCEHFGGHPYCMAGTCVVSNLGPPDCFEGDPMGSADFANQCSIATCGAFDNCDRLGLCGSSDTVPAAVNPPDAAAGAAVDAATPPAMPPCVDPSARNTVVISGSTAVQPFMAVVAPILATNSPPYQIAYQPSGSCTGIGYMFATDPAKQLVKDIPGKQALLFNTDGTSAACTFGTGVPLDVAVSDVYSQSCNSADVANAQFADYHGPIQPMVFVVPSSSTETTISAEMGHVVFGLGSTDPKAAPWIDPTLYFVRNASSGTQVMISRAVNLNANTWWGIDRGGSSQVRDLMESVSPDKQGAAIGILSTDFADAERGRLRELAYKGEDQTCAYYPDSTVDTRDKANVRDGHYSIWGPIHFYAKVTGGVPSAAAGALVTRFTLSRPDQTLLDAITKIGFVPDCAMRVQRSAEMGPLSDYAPAYQCSCYYDANVVGGAAGSACTACTGPSDCPTSLPACNNGYCEKQ